MPSATGSSQPRDQIQVSLLQAEILLPCQPPGKPKNTVVGSQSLLQENFPTQESNWSLLHCRQILYQLSYPGSPLFRYLLICMQSLSCVRLFATPWTVACLAPLSTEFSRQEYWSGLPFPLPGIGSGSSTCRWILYHLTQGSPHAYILGTYITIKCYHLKM